MDRKLKYEVRFEKSFVKRMDNLQSMFNLSSVDTMDARMKIIDAVEILAMGKELDSAFDDHKLLREPWTGYHEFHVLNDLLVIYYQVDAKKRLRMVTITNHKELSTGKL